ncbi:MAG: riboflavin synthase [Thermodesulfovibrionales bacterium]
MFTGIIIEMGDVVSLRRKEAGASLAIRAREIARDAAIGDSIAVSGVCLTVVERGDAGTLSFDLSRETLESTNLGQLRPGEKVNLEPPLMANGKLGGHFVTGHVDAVGKIRSKTMVGDTFKVLIEAPERITDFLVEKGSIAVDGISLTVVDVFRDAFTVFIIPHTASLTTLGFKGPGDAVNLEGDIIGKYVARFMGKATDERLMESLMRAGYI